MEQLKAHWVEILLTLIGLLAGGIALKVAVTRNRNKKKVDASANVVSQSGNIAGGDIVGRDKK